MEASVGYFRNTKSQPHCQGQAVSQQCESPAGIFSAVPVIVSSMEWQPES